MKELVAGVDIGGTNTVYGLVDREGTLYGEGVIPTARYVDFDEYMEQLYIGISELSQRVNDKTPSRLIGVGVGAPNGNYYSGTIDDAANLIWKGSLPIVQRLERFFPGTLALVTNDANAAAIGEMMYGAAKGLTDFITVTLGTGIGSGFVSKGELIYGHDSFAGELGHVIVTPEGRTCGCGRKGCLETYASATGIKRTIFKLMADFIGDCELRSVSFDDLDSAQVTQAALDGDPLAIEAYEHTGKILGLALANAVAITSPQAIILVGGLAKAGKYIFEPTRRSMEENLLYNFKGKVKLLESGLKGKNAAVLGASALIWQKIEAGKN